MSVASESIGAAGAAGGGGSPPAPPAATATHEGWTHVRAVGAKAPAAPAPDLSGAAASVTLIWNAALLSAGSVDSYNVYRATAAGAETFATPYATGVSAATRTFVDAAAVGGTTYYYNVAPVSGGVVSVPAAAADREIKVVVPPANMALLHRWMANLEMCGLMGKAVDRDQNYRCAMTGAGGTGTHFDLGHSVLIDAYEQGCGYTAVATRCASANGCIGVASTPAGIASNQGDVFYSRRTGNCYVNTSVGTGTTWSGLDSVAAAVAQTAASNAPGLPPLVATPAVADVLCKGQTVAGLAGTKRLLRRQEFVIASAWDSSLADAAIATRESGLNLDATGNCNANGASPQGATNTNLGVSNPTIAFDNSAYPAAANRDTLPGCRHGDCSGAGVGAIRSLRTGSVATANCVSRFGMQDLVGNVAEWNSDQIRHAGGVGAGIVSSIDANDDLVGVDFDDVQAPTFGNAATFDSYTSKIEFPHAFPVTDPAYASGGTTVIGVAQLHGDAIWVNTADTGDWAVLSGGGFDTSTAAGRYFTYLRGAAVNGGWEATGFRCAIDAD